MSRRVMIGLIALSWLTGVALGDTVTFYDGGVHTFDWAAEPGNLSVRYATTVNVVDDASFDDGNIRDTSIVNVSGGTFNNLTAHDTSIANVSGGTFNRLTASETSTVDVSGGTFDTLNAWGTSTVDVSGGTFTHLNTYGTSMADVFGGTLGRLTLSQESTVNVFGGTITGLTQRSSGLLDVVAGTFDNLRANAGTTKVSGGIFSDELFAESASTVEVTGGIFTKITARDESTFDIWGTNLDWSGISGEHLTGTLLDGTVLDIAVVHYDSAQINLHNTNPVPEPSTLATLSGLLGMGLIAGWWRKRRKL